MNKIKYLHLIFYWIISFFFTINLFSQELPPIKNYTPIDYSGENQNWSISQGNNDFIYVANNSGLLEFNGSQWNLYPSPNDTFIRAIKAIDSKIYTGCFREFGFWVRDKVGGLSYTSLSNDIIGKLHEDEHIWNIVSLDKWVLFQSLHNIYIYNTTNKTFDIIGSKSGISKMFKLGDNIYFQKNGEGIFKIENGEGLLVSNNELLKSNILVGIYEKGDSLLFLTQRKGFFLYKNNKLKKWNIPFNEQFPLISVYSSLNIKQGGFILGTISNGIYHLNKNGELIYKIDREKGIINNTVLSMFEDKEQNLWLGLDNGISTINLNSPFSVYTSLDGRIGSVYTSKIHNGNLYLGTNQGLFYKEKGSEDFKLIQGTEGQVWCLKIYDDTLFCGHNLGTFEVNEGSARLITDKMGTWDIVPIKEKQNFLLQGHYNGINIIEKKNGKWQYRNEIEGFNISSRYLAIDSQSKVFVSHEWKGIFKLNIDDDFKKVINYNIEKSSLKGSKSSLIKFKEDLLYTTNKGIFKFDEQVQKFILDSTLSSKFLSEEKFISGKLIPDEAENVLWSFTDKNILYFKPTKLDSELEAVKLSLPSSLRNFIPSYENITHLNNQIYLCGTAEGYILIDFKKVIKKEHEITINYVEKSALNGVKSPINLNQIKEFEFNNNSLYFSYNVPQFDKFQEVNYKYQLKGLYNNWSEWSTKPEIAFKNLPFGDYIFKVKARIGNDFSKNVATYSFTILRPWYISNLFIVFYSIAIIAMFFSIHILYWRYYNKQKRKMLIEKQRQLTLNKLESEKVIMSLKNDKLKNDVESKTRELSTSSMNILRKNELLNIIKKELDNVKGEKEVKAVYKIIDKNLTKKGDWKIFEDAINNIDQDFLKRIKELHPNLTSNDLRLCTYLRLNLASKEIAPLLNISPRSVEIKRYRLRKKMQLQHEKSLAEYILKM